MDKPVVETVVAVGYDRVTGSRQHYITEKLPDLSLNVCPSPPEGCGHWDRSGAANRCDCDCHRGGTNG
jgi:hypothetical protein